jgi:ferrochelatase
MSFVKTGVLLVNLGTPDEPTPRAVKRYLSEFLMDKRVIDVNRWIWTPLLKGLILPRRAPRVAKLYQSVWTEQGAPLLAYSRQQQQALDKCLSADILVEVAMTYGSPSVDDAITRLLAQGVKRLIVLPLYPQYSGTTTGAAWDALNRALARRRNIPEVIFIRDYAQHPLYISALAESVERSFSENGKPELLVFSYHGIPQRYAKEGDDYPLRCTETTQALVAKLNLNEDQYLTVYQSRFGREEWLKPYADVTLQALAHDGVKHIQVICPGFSCDCLETVEEVAVTNRNLFLSTGGETYHYIPALNAEPLHIRLLQQLILAHLPSAD